MKPVVWMRAVRDAAEHPPGARLAVLWALALRMRKDGGGFASQRQLADDTGVDERTARRAVKWGQDAGYLVRTRRGHRLSNEKSLANEYQLVVPSQQDSSVPLAPSGPGAESESQQGSGVPLAESQQDSRPFQQDSRPSQWDTGVLPRGLSTRGLSTRGPDGASGSPNGDRVEDLEDLEDLDFKDAFQFGKAVAELCNTGAEIFDEQFLDAVRARYGCDGEKTAFAGFHRYRTKAQQGVPW